MKTITNSMRSQSGLTLVELMVAMTIGMVLIGGTLFVYSNARAAYTTNENFALMQENARFALSIIEPDVQLAGYWGLHREPSVIIGNAIELNGDGEVLPDISSDCGDNWIVQFDQYIEGYNDVELPFTELACLDGGQNGNVQPGSDIFALRRVNGDAVEDTALVPGQYYLRSSEKPLSEVFLGTDQPTTMPDSSANYALVANAYYVSPTSVGSPAVSGSDEDTIPSLRRVQLVNRGGAAAMVDTEITTGVEDIQVQYGIGPPNAIGTRGGVNHYVSNIENLTAPNTTIRSMRIWLLMRSERPAVDYIDDKEYRLGDKIITPREDNYRRMVVSKTIFFRNLH